MRLFKALFVFAAIGIAASPVKSAVVPHPIFSDNMVLQRDRDILIWGKATPGQVVQTTLERNTPTETLAAAAGTTADKDGNWSVKFAKQKPGTGYKLTITDGKNTFAYKNVAVGEVWVCSGQSNMEMSVGSSETPAKVKAEAKNPDLRLFTVSKRISLTPITDQGDLKHFSKWVESSPETVGGFSAVAYHFGQKLQSELKVPVGLIHTSWGGTPCEAWTSIEALETESSLKYYAAGAKAASQDYEKAKLNYDPKKAQEAYNLALEKWKLDAEKAKADGKPVPKEPAKPTPPGLPGAGTPAVLFNAMIYPLLNFKVRGAIWYQGEANTGKAYEYRTLLPAMIEDWRKRFDCDLPFMIVQLAPYWNGNSAAVTYAELRDAQLFATKKLPKVGIAIITDAGDEKDIHPKPKQPVGERLALAALGIEYGKKLEYYGPMLKEAKFDGATATLSFDHATGGLVAKGGELTGFTLLGEDKMFHPAKAEIKGETIVVSSDKVAKAVAVRYGWVNFAKPTLNLFNGEGLPATPFRTDDLPLTTDYRKR